MQRAGTGVQNQYESRYISNANTSTKSKPTRIASANTTSYNSRTLMNQGRIRRLKKGEKSDMQVTS